MPTESVDTTRLLLPIHAEDHVYGPESADFTLVEYGDYECPDCGRLFQIIRDLQATLGDRLQIVYRHYPVSGSHPHAQEAAEAAEAAGAQGRFWEMHDLLFQHQNALNRKDLFGYGERLSLDMNRFRGELKKGRQAYVVYPRVEDSEQGAIKAVTQEREHLQRVFAPFQIGLLHGRLKSAEKQEVMRSFRENRVHVLVATSVIEVGVDVPNATVMLIENAEQFGLAQLHQLRGRIGRGAHDAYCILVAAAKGREARQRLRVLEETNDGFRIAEEDLKLRGPGELLGQQQSGLPNFRFGDLSTDLELIQQARQLVNRT